MTHPEHLNQTDIGKLFGVTRNKIGQWLTYLGLRDGPDMPSEKAIRGGFVKKVPTRKVDRQTYHVWHTAKTIAALEGAGFRRVDATPPKTRPKDDGRIV